MSIETLSRLWGLCLYIPFTGVALAGAPTKIIPQQVEVTLGGCHFQYIDPYSNEKQGDGGYTLHNASKIHKTEMPDLFITFQCKASDAEDVASGTNGVFLDKDGKWKADYAWMKAKGYDLPSKAMHYTVFNLNAVNASGYGVTTDDTIGEEWRRTRYLHACLLHPPVALCAYGEVMRLQDPRGNLLPYVLKVLRSIEFLDGPAPPATQSAVDKP